MGGGGDKKLQRNTNNSRHTNTTSSAHRTTSHTRVHSDNESNKYGRRGNSSNAEQFSNNKMKITRKQARDDHSAVQSPRAPRSDNIPDPH